MMFLTHLLRTDNAAGVACEAADNHGDDRRECRQDYQPPDVPDKTKSK